ncbi:MAG TPA: S-layer protein domain-containing protein [Candidatus Methylomirabilis sp.]|nr:S-layer protein domain-containing protein [Candidatus Methylomirabilis sp.]
MDKGSGFALVPIFVIVFLACGALAAEPVSPPASRFVWEPGENLTFTWTAANFDGFYYDAQSGAGNESLTITLDRSRLFGMMKLTKVSDTGITMTNIPVNLKRGSIIDIGELELKVADSNTLRVHLYKKWLYVKGEHRGATGSNNLTAWDGLNYAGFLYDADSGNYSESLVITNLTGRRIPRGGLTYTSYRLRKVPYAVTNITGKKPEGTDGSYVTFSLGGKKYTARNNGFAELLIAHGDSISEKKTLLGRPPWFEGVDEAGQPVPWEDDTWELGEGYALTVKSIDTMSNVSVHTPVGVNLIFL